MKKYLYLLLLALVPAMTFTACGNDKDDELDPGDIELSKPVMKESGNTITFSYSTSYAGLTVNFVETYTFNNDEVVKVTISETFPSESLAKQFMEEIQNDPKEKVSYKDITRSGKTITWDGTKSYSGYSKSQVKKMLQWRTEEWDHMMDF